MQLEHALHLCREVRDTKGEGWVLHNLGRMCLELGKLEEAKAYLNQAWKIRSEISDVRGMGWTLFHIGKVALEQHEHEEALASLLSAQRIFEDIQHSDRTQI